MVRDAQWRQIYMVRHADWMAIIEFKSQDDVYWRLFCEGKLIGKSWSHQCSNDKSLHTQHSSTDAIYTHPPYWCHQSVCEASSCFYGNSTWWMAAIMADSRLCTTCDCDRCCICMHSQIFTYRLKTLPFLYQIRIR